MGDIRNIKKKAIKNKILPIIKYENLFKKVLKIQENPSSYELKLFQKIQKYIKFISWIPSLKMVAICNSLSMYATKNTWSDIDLFIVTTKNRLWITRIIITFIFQVFGVRRHGNKIKNRFCLSFFITEEAMDFSHFAIENDIYLYFWIYYLKPIYNKNYTYENFVKANEKMWINEENLHIDNLRFLIKSKNYKIWHKKKENFISKLFIKITDLIEIIIKKILLPRTIKKSQNLKNNSWIIIENNILKFHDNDKRLEIRDKIIRMSKT